MPLYNAERFVGESIGNILGQTVGDFELIVIDDASTDSSYDIASRYAAQDARIVLMRNDANHGAAYTRNRGLETARGSFITFMDADDRCSPERFARQTAFFGQHPQIDLCGSYYTMFGPDDAREQKIQDPITHEGIRIQMLFGCPFAMSGVMMRRGAFLRSGVRFRATMAEDYLFWAELSGHMRMANIPEHLSFYRRWENQLSTSQLDRQTLSAQAIQRDLLRTTLGMTLTDEESADIHADEPPGRDTAARRTYDLPRPAQTTLPRKLRTQGLRSETAAQTAGLPLQARLQMFLSLVGK